MKTITLATALILQFFINNSHASTVYGGSLNEVCFYNGFEMPVNELSEAFANDNSAPISLKVGEVMHVEKNGAHTGSIKLNVTGGHAPYQFSIGNGSFQPSNKINNLAAGFYLVTVMDANGNVSNIPVVIYQPFLTSETENANSN